MTTDTVGNPWDNEDPDKPEHFAPVSSMLLSQLSNKLTDHPERDYWDESNRMEMADAIDGLAESASDAGPDSVVMAVDQLRRIAAGLRGRDSFSPPQLYSDIFSYIQ